jgi:hypothetical protein
MISDLTDADLTRIYNQTNNIAAGQHVPITTQRIFAAMRAAMASANERADYAWRNTHTIEKARQEEMVKRDALQTEVAMLRHHLTELAKFADRAALVLATIEAEDTAEGEMLQEIIDGTQRWAPDAIRGQVASASVSLNGKSTLENFAQGAGQ